MQRGMRWRRGGSMLSNLHHMVGIWVAIPLGVVALTGIYLGFPQQSCSLLASFFDMTPAARGAFAAPLLHPTIRSIDQAFDAALAAVPGAKPSAISLPTRQQVTWRIELFLPSTGAAASVVIDDASGAVRISGPQPAGDRIAVWLQWIHEGSHAGWAWRTIVFLCGLSPPLLGITGIIVWIQRRRPGRSEASRDIQPRFRAAE
jgi:uncharacterized iron-regulated membrane protein